MKAYYASSFAFKKGNEKEWKEILAAVEDAFGKANVFYAGDEIEISGSADEKSILDSVKKREDALKNSDVLIAVGNDSSAGVGYSIHNAVTMRKPVMILMSKDAAANYSHTTFTAGKIKQINFEQYSNTDEIAGKIKKFAIHAKNMLDTKFILIISPEIDRYLEWAADFKRMHKAQIVRNAVEEMMEKDSEFKKAQKED